MEVTARGHLITSLAPGQKQLYGSNSDICPHSSYRQLMRDTLQASWTIYSNTWWVL